MLSDFQIIQHKFPKNEDLTIVPISDVHLGAAEHMAKEWQDFCAMVEKTPNVYITLGGDLINNTVKTSVGNVFGETMRPREQKRVMAEMLKPISDRILCAVSRNHRTGNCQRYKNSSSGNGQRRRSESPSQGWKPCHEEPESRSSESVREWLHPRHGSP